MNTTAHDLGSRAYAALLAGDWPTLRTLLHDDATWTLPGDHALSGTTVGADAVIAQMQKVADHGVQFRLERLLTSRDNLALLQHNTGHRGDVVLDEHLATVCRLRDGRIAEIETFADDVPGMNAFFV
ncbi:nuclear transport factor 2 family protein [Amycolatopsis rhizosphaerae]|uniref:Nuclear transport factor 2 family protein n=1 Tax=Amycolatopsis rhizosphaerae TaxID=2053003 RepID=A0A558C791_9PSEU|nr:nuclear transport factor 2 family protein [Amycolatopsis rhizosphaerae]TVT44557.1 nuclear transport factor 2 family protein [Amycolatopsis rhizosphaerae]